MQRFHLLETKKVGKRMGCGTDFKCFGGGLGFGV